MEDSVEMMTIEDSVEMTTSSSYNSFSQSGGVLEINMDLLPRYKPSRNPIASSSPSICSPYLSNGLHSRISDPNTRSQLGPKFGYTRLSKVVVNIEKMLNDKEWDYSDADIVVDGNSVGVNRFVLASTCSFFHRLFSKERPTGEGRPKFYMSDLVPAGMVGYEAFLLILGYLYSGNLKAYPHEVSTCVDDSCSHEICFPPIDFQLQLLYASATFQIDELVSLLQKRLLDILNEVAIDDILVILSAANACGKYCKMLLVKCIELVAKSDVDLTTLDKVLCREIVKQIMDLRLEFGSDVPERTSFHDKHVKRIYHALDSVDIELVRMLLKEGQTNLDDVHALHYAVAFCDLKTTRKLLDLELADVNNRNSRGYTVLHIAARRKDPQIIVSLLLRGARPSDLTPDFQAALQIAKRTTRAANYHKSTEEGKPTPKELLCIEVLEQAERRTLLLGDASHSLATEWDDLRMKLLYLECRVGFSRLLFPTEAEVVMGIAHVDSTSAFQLANVNPTDITGAQRSGVDLNEAPFRIKEEQLKRLGALSRTVELGKRYFPRCSEALNKIMDADDLSQLACMVGGTPEERSIKRQRYQELRDVLIKAFTEDKKEYERSVVTFTSSSRAGSRSRSDGKVL